jgi:hypothetical protein
MKRPENRWFARAAQDTGAHFRQPTGARPRGSVYPQTLFRSLTQEPRR